ncbi:thyrotroph embryonic factor [Rhipicephalus sanguineus]|uniref:thyrotroph embryonic factor n=1 Tax=Rhipicephalus sanguineus TaxID=34632 RepID=UPI0020C465CC|nr:thyrotroph embryonic factor [Rhipicephalus sanguineus]
MDEALLGRPGPMAPTAYGIGIRGYLDGHDMATRVQPQPPPGAASDRWTSSSADKKEKLDSKDTTAAAYDTGAASAGSGGGGAMLWDRTLSELKLEYMDLDEFLSENGVAGKGVAALSPRHNPFRQAASSMVDPHRLAPDPGGLQQQQQSDEPALAGPPPNGEPPGCTQQRLAHNSSPGFDAAEGACYSMQSLAEHFRGDEVTSRRPACDPMAAGRRSGSPTATVVPIDCGFTKTDLALANLPGHDDFDPSHHPFSEDELKPQPIVKKSRKQFVPNELKDDKYWARRQKNNIAAKRSREVRRVKENQIVLRASYLEKENIALREEVHKLQQENDMLRKRLHEYEP